MTANATSFQPGRSGNPGGRPKERPIKDGKTLRELAQERTLDALMTLEEVMKDKEATPAARVSAASTILDRGWGKSTTPIDLEVNSDGLAERLMRARARMMQCRDDGDADRAGESDA